MNLSESIDLLISNKPVSGYSYLQAAKAALTAVLRRKGVKYKRIGVHAQGNTAAIAFQPCYDNPDRFEIDFVMPKLPESGMLSRIQADTFTGYWLHESLHVLYTQHDLYTKDGIPSPFFKSLVNALEDCRIEMLAIDDSVAVNLLSCLTRLRRHTFNEIPTERLNELQANPLQSLGWLCKIAINRDYGVDCGAASFLANLPVEVQQIISYARSEALKPAFKHSHGAYELAERIMQMIQQPPQDADQQAGDGEQGEQDGDQQDTDQQGDDQQAGDGEQGEGDSGDADDTEQDADGSDGEADDESGDTEQDADGGSDSAEGDDSGDADDTDGDADADQQAGEGEQGDDETDSGDAGADQSTNWSGLDENDPGMSPDDNVDGLFGDNDTGEEKLDLAVIQYDDEDLASLLDKRRDMPHISDYSSHRSNRYGGDDDYVKQLVDERLKGTQRLENALRKLIKSDSRTGIDTFKQRGMLDRRALTRGKSGNSNVFKKRWHVQAENTAVMIITDVSSSMHGQEILLAAAFERAACRALNRAKSPYAVINYNDSPVIKKRFNENLTQKQVDERALKAVNLCAGGTDTTTAITQGADEFAMLPATTKVTRRIILVITDGGCSRGTQMVRDAQAYARSQGVDAVYGIGIGMDLEHRGYDAHETITAESLPRTGLSMLLKAAA